MLLALASLVFLGSESLDFPFRRLLSWALVGYELLYPALGLNREHLVEGFSFDLCYANEYLFAADIHFYCLKQFVETPLLDFISGATIA
jgi:hypothetical protein